MIIDSLDSFLVWLIHVVYALTNQFNTAMDTWAGRILTVGLSIVLLVYTRKRIQKDGWGKGLYMGIMAIVEAILLVIIIYYIPEKISNKINYSGNAIVIRWGIIYLLALSYSYFLTNKMSNKRGVFFVFIILTTLLVGWIYDHWAGMLFISMPILSIYFHIIQKVAQVIFPASNPEDQEEIWQKTRAFLVYLFGIQHPIWFANANASREYETKIDGDQTKDIGRPGVIWTHSHQVAGISKNIEFNRVAGPGIIFTKQYEVPVALVDLRTQVRVSLIDAVTKDGMKIPLTTVIVFVIDKKSWSRADYAKLRHTTGRNYDIDHNVGSYPYSSGRVRTVLSTSGINNGAGNPIHWDEWVAKQMEHATREIISARSLDELWRPQNDKQGASALEEMAQELKKVLTDKLAEIGITLLVARVINYRLEYCLKKPEKLEAAKKTESPKDAENSKNSENSEKPDEQQKPDEKLVKTDPIVQQNINIWRSYWEQRITETNADIEFIYRDEIEKAHAYSKSVLLSAVADSIRKAHQIHEDLPRHVIAQYFVHALEEYVKGQPGLNIEASKKRLEGIKDILFYRTEGNE